MSENEIIFIWFKVSTDIKNNNKKEHILLILRIILPPPYWKIFT